MAHFAQLDERGYVTWVVVIANEDILDGDGKESEEIGQARCQELFDGGRWIQASYSSAFRGKYPSIGDYYDEELDEFV